MISNRLIYFLFALFNHLLAAIEMTSRTFSYYSGYCRWRLHLCCNYNYCMFSKQIIRSICFQIGWNLFYTLYDNNRWFKDICSSKLYAHFSAKMQNHLSPAAADPGVGILFPDMTLRSDAVFLNARLWTKNYDRNWNSFGNMYYTKKIW